MLCLISFASLPSVAQENLDTADRKNGRDSSETNIARPDSSATTVDIPYYQVEDAPLKQTVAATDTNAFSPDPVKAVWYSALCPGLGQIYNRSYWKLPILIGGYLGLIYATNWNARYFNDYSRPIAMRWIMTPIPTVSSIFSPIIDVTIPSGSRPTWLGCKVL